MLDFSAILLISVGIHISDFKKHKFHNLGNKKTYGIIIPL